MVPIDQRIIRGETNAPTSLRRKLRRFHGVVLLDVRLLGHSISREGMSLQ
jgi:hypothetical protein